MKRFLAILLSLSILLAFAIGIFYVTPKATKVNINYNISDYLNENSETKITLNILENEFGTTSDVQIMATSVTVEQALQMQNLLAEIPNVLTVNFDEHDENYFQNNNALLLLVVDGDEYSTIANQVVSDAKSVLKKEFPTQEITFGGIVVEKDSLRSSIENEIVWIFAIAIVLVTLIMLLSARSWLEPFVLLLASGVAILLNMGTNVYLGEISYITNAVAAILQLALSVDYSIVLMHHYVNLKETEEIDSGTAMLRSVFAVVKPVSASSLTTIAGLLALLFMSFRIGVDIGIVLIKGIVISAITSLTLLPALLILFEGLLDRTEKPALIPTGKGLCSFARVACFLIVPIIVLAIPYFGYIQKQNTYTFTDGSNGSQPIKDIFGNNSTIVVVYPNSANNHENENTLADKLNAYKTADGKLVLKNYTAYSNTVRELYDVELTARKLDIPESDVKMLLSMYHLYGDSSLVKLKPLDFVKYADELIREDADTQEFTDEEMTKTIRTMLVIDTIMNGEHTADEFHTLATTDVMEGTDLDLFSVKQMYGSYFYDEITDKTVDFETMLDYMIAASEKDETADMFDEQTVTDLTALSQGIKQFNAQMEMPMTKAQFQGYMYQNYGATIDDTTAAQIWAGYYYTLAQAEQETIPFLNLMSFLVAQNQITEPTAVATINAYNTLYVTVNASYPYEQFLPVLTQVATGLSGTAPTIATTALAVQQVYIMYFYEQNTIPTTALLGKTFVDFVNQTLATNAVVNAQLSADGKAKLTDICVADEFLSDTTSYDFKKMAEKLTELQDDIQSMTTATALGSDKVSGIYIKYAIGNELDLAKAVEAKELLNFVTANMDTHELLKKKMTDDHRAKVADAQDDIASATDLFLGESYSRMLLSIDLPSESEESTKFVEYLTRTVGDTFGEDAHIAGEMVSTYDLQETFDKDNTFISIFTIISIFVIVMLVFRSLSLPTVLVAVIQGAIWIAMSPLLSTEPMFFMSYIVVTCILMGATIDYGILMSTNYVQYRATLDKKEALCKSVEAAMPTVFTSGMILTVCGFVIGFISSQNAISTVGILLGKGTLVSVLMITLVLPSVLYLVDGFILKLSIKKREKKEENIYITRIL